MKRRFKKNKDLTHTVDLVEPFHISLEGTGRSTTTCGPYHKACHNNCLINDNSNKFCFWCMNAHGRCRKVCSRNCLWSEHKNLPYLIDYRTVTETRTAKHPKKKYHQTVKEQNDESKRGIAPERACRGAYHDQKGSTKSLSLDEIALKQQNVLTQEEYLGLLIESEIMEAKPG